MTMPHNRVPADQGIVHDLKVWPEYFAALADGRKTFEVRKNDRGFKEGDTLRLREWSPFPVTGGGDYTGREVTRRVGYILKGGSFGVPDDFVVMAIHDPSVADLVLQVQTLTEERDYLAKEATSANAGYARLGARLMAAASEEAELKRQLTEAHAERERLAAERDDLAGTVLMLRDLSESKGLCGHPAAYSHTEDGGKTIDCWQCEAERLAARVYLLECHVRSLRDGLDECAHPEDGWPEVWIADAYEASREDVPDLEAAQHAVPPQE